MLLLDFHPLVEFDLADSAIWYARQQSGLDGRFLSEARECFTGIRANAFLYSIRFSDIRRMNLPVFKHGIFYFIADEAAVVLAILHGYRDSRAELWQRRKKYD
jgi:hypothetical protein